MFLCSCFYEAVLKVATFETEGVKAMWAWLINASDIRPALNGCCAERAACDNALPQAVKEAIWPWRGKAAASKKRVGPPT
jgi:hypothetical protein